ncbi:MAG: penicillin-binding protein activator LpoB [Candidatus Arsenophonus melophagi]|nr:penicillin-binding protein activator LpoB [Candidatus Arsenophonus melophagi]
MRSIAQLMIVTLLSVGCSSIPNKKTTPAFIIKLTESTKRKGTPTFLDTIPYLPQVTAIDLSQAVLPLVNQLISSPWVKSGRILLIDLIKNNTNMSIQAMQATDAIINVINNQHVFKLVPQSVVLSARKAFGLSLEDSLVTRSKSIGLARYVQADYVLYSVISGNQKKSKIDMQLIETQSGEILWTGTNHIK